MTPVVVDKIIDKYILVRNILLINIYSYINYGRISIYNSYK